MAGRVRDRRVRLLVWPHLGDMRRLRVTLSFANVTSVIALFVALSGTSYAITKLPRNSVGSAQVRDGSLAARDLASDARSSGPRGPRGPVGPPGAEGQRGVSGTNGAQGERGPSNVIIAPRGPNVSLFPTANTVREVRRINNVPAGSWILSFSADAVLTSPQGMYAVCSIKVNGDVKADGALVVGQAGAAVQEGPIPVETAVTQSTPFNVTVDCYQDQNAGGNPTVIIARAQLIATQVAQVTVAP